MIKHATLTLITTLLFSSNINAQYKPILGDSISTWYVNSCNINQTQCVTDFYSAIGDTMVNGLTFKFLDDFHFNRSVLIREDTNAGQVFLRPLFGFRKYSDVLLYDFSLEKDDAIEVYNPNSPIPDSLGYYKVDSTNYITSSQGDSLKRLYLSREPLSNDYSQTIWVEGIGSLSLLNTSGQYPDLTGVGELGCFFFDGVHRYESSLIKQNQGTCNLNFSSSTTSISTLEDNRPLFQLRELEEHTYQISGSLDVEIIEISVYSLTGKLMYQTKKSPEEEFSLIGLSQGIYLVHLSQGHTSSVVKLLY